MLRYTTPALSLTRRPTHCHSVDGRLFAIQYFTGKLIREAGRFLLLRLYPSIGGCLSSLASSRGTLAPVEVTSPCLEVTRRYPWVLEPVEVNLSLPSKPCGLPWLLRSSLCRVKTLPRSFLRTYCPSIGGRLSLLNISLDPPRPLLLRIVGLKTLLASS
jgi:hypothetical protein